MFRVTTEITINEDTQAIEYIKEYVYLDNWSHSDRIQRKKSIGE